MTLYMSWAGEGLKISKENILPSSWKVESGKPQIGQDRFDQDGSGLMKIGEGWAKQVLGQSAEENHGQRWVHWWILAHTAEMVGELPVAVSL